MYWIWHIDISKCFTITSYFRLKFTSVQIWICSLQINSLHYKDIYESSKDFKVDSKVKSSDIVSHSCSDVTKLSSDDIMSAGLKNEDLNFKDLKFILLKSHFSAHHQSSSSSSSSNSSSIFICCSDLYEIMWVKFLDRLSVSS